MSKLAVMSYENFICFHFNIQKGEDIFFFYIKQPSGSLKLKIYASVRNMINIYTTLFTSNFISDLNLDKNKINAVYLKFG